MLNVYLDQNKWVALAQAETRHPLGEPHRHALGIFKRAVDEGRARFPLSATHYFETAKQNDRRRRLELAATMARLAGLVRIAPPQAIVPRELCGALVEVLEVNRIKRETDARFVHGQEEIAAQVQQHGRQHIANILLASVYRAIREPLAQAVLDVGLPHVEGLSERFGAIVEATPSRWVEMKLRQQRQANPQKAWHGNDLNDVIALSVAVPYCDVVVTERSWSSMLAAVKVPERYDTLVTPNLQDVVDRLA